jgi:hypothetical protein
LKKSSTKGEEGILASVDKQTQSLQKELNMEIQMTQFDIQVTKMLVEATWYEFTMQLAEVKTQAGCGRCRNTVIGAEWIHPPRFEGSMFWTLFHHQLKAMAEHNWTA